MKLLRTLFVASSILALSAATVSAQAAQVTCKDGAKSKGGRGACSGHGGIALAAKADIKADMKAGTPEAKAEAKTDKAEVKVAKHHKKSKKAKA